MKDKSHNSTPANSTTKNQHSQPKPNVHIANNHNQKPSNGKVSPPKPMGGQPNNQAAAIKSVSSEDAANTKQSRLSPSDSANKKNTSSETDNNSENVKGKERAVDSDNGSIHKLKDQNDNNKQSRIIKSPSLEQNRAEVSSPNTKPTDNNNTSSSTALIKSNAMTQTTAKPVMNKPPTSKQNSPTPTSSVISASHHDDTPTDLTTQKPKQASNHQDQQPKTPTAIKEVAITPSPPLPVQSQSQLQTTTPISQQGQSVSLKAKSEPEEAAPVHVTPARAPPQDEPLELKVNSKVPSYVAVS